MDAYTGLWRAYDRLMDDVDYDGWAAYYRGLWRGWGVNPRRVCDLGCGTGQFTRRLAAMGLDVVGIDRSEEMLMAAQAAARKSGVRARFVRGDMRAFSLPRPVDVILCACDGVNYLTRPGDVRACFRAVAEGLRPGGVFAFDVSSRHKLEGMGGQFYGETREEVCVLWSNAYDPGQRLLTMDLTIFIQEADGGSAGGMGGRSATMFDNASAESGDLYRGTTPHGASRAEPSDLYRRHEETHIQRAHDAEELTRWLQEAGFVQVEVFGDRTMAPPGPQEMRIHFRARTAG